MSIQTGRDDVAQSEDRAERMLVSAGISVAGMTLVIGYLLTILTTTHLTWMSFAVFTALQVVYCVVLWWLITATTSELQKLLQLGLLTVLTLGIGLVPLLGLGWDWLLFLVTLALFFNLLNVRLAIGAGVFLFLIMTINLDAINGWRWAATYGSLFTLLSAYAFVAVFSLVIHALDQQKSRMGVLFRQLEASNAELERAHRQLQEYASEVEELTIVRERTRIAREIHDTLGHYLSILNIQLETISKLQERDPARAIIEVAEARRVAAQSMQEVRNAVSTLRPTSIASLSLTEAIEQLGKEFERSFPDITLTLDLDAQLLALSPDFQVALYRAAQESLTNIRKHAQASKALVRLRHEHTSLELTIIDNGRGPNSSINEQQGFGLVGLSERIELLGGEASYGPNEQGGYRVNIRIPITETSQAD